MQLDWLKLAEVLGINIGLVMVIYWLIADRRDFNKRLFDAIASVDRVFYILEKMERRMKRDA